jgi:hypothetical protein
MTPVVRDLDGHIYFREYAGRILAGGFEPVSKPVFVDGIIPGTCVLSCIFNWGVQIIRRLYFRKSQRSRVAS